MPALSVRSDGPPRRRRLMAWGALAVLLLELGALLWLRQDPEKARFSTFLLADAGLAAVICVGLLLTLRRQS